MTAVLLGPNGKPLPPTNKKESPPSLGEKFGSIAAVSDLDILRLPGGGSLMFDLDRLTLSDYRQMKDHYQVNNSLAVLTFMLHQMEWHVECENKKMQSFYEEQLYNVWSRLVRAMSQAFWAGYSPNVLQWENDVQNRAIVLDKVKDVRPEHALVNWREVEGWAPPGKTGPKLKIYDGIKIFGAPYPVPVPNSYWYPLLMQENNYYGVKLLRSAFQPWFFSQLIHLFSNRYFERFGEPIPVGRAPYDDSVTVNGQTVQGNVLMGSILSQFRNRSVAVLPNDRTPVGDETTIPYDYQIEYLESQMRGADFERYMTRLDEEISLSLFTPILMMRTADVGSYNLGTQHTMVYMWMLNAISGDWTFYINKYILRPLRDYNDPAGANGPMPRIKFVKNGKIKAELLQALMLELLKEGKLKLNARELGELAGISAEDVETLVGDNEPGSGGDEGGSGEGGETPPTAPPAPSEPARQGGSRREALATGRAISSRVAAQVRKAFANGTFGDLTSPSMGYRRRMEEALRADGHPAAMEGADNLYDLMDNWITRTVTLGPDEFGDADTFMRLFNAKLTREIEAL